MINTLARHLAAVSEARRLIGMVLANNPAFRAFAQADGRLPIGQTVPCDLSNDCYFAAYCHLTDTLESLSRESSQTGNTPDAGPVSLPDCIVEITRREPAGTTACSNQGGQATPTVASATSTSKEGLATLRPRLSHIVDGPAVNFGPTEPSCASPGEEARVAIVRGGLD